MLVPIRCFSCSTQVGHIYPELAQRVKAGHEFGTVMSECGVRRYCCKRMLVTHVDLGRMVAEYEFDDASDGLSRLQCIAQHSRDVSCD